MEHLDIIILPIAFSIGTIICGIFLAMRSRMPCNHDLLMAIMGLMLLIVFFLLSTAESFIQGGNGDMAVILNAGAQGSLAALAGIVSLYLSATTMRSVVKSIVRCLFAVPKTVIVIIVQAIMVMLILIAMLVVAHVMIMLTG